MHGVLVVVDDGVDSGSGSGSGSGARRHRAAVTPTTIHPRNTTATRYACLEIFIFTFTVIFIFYSDDLHSAHVAPPHSSMR